MRDTTRDVSPKEEQHFCRSSCSERPLGFSGQQTWRHCNALSRCPSNQAGLFHKMPRKNICLLTPYEAQDLMVGKPVNCARHRHVDSETARLLVFGADQVPWLDDDYARDMGSKNAAVRRKASISERVSQEVETITGQTERRGPAVWATLPNGEKSSRHLELELAREWQGIGGTIQWAPVGTAKQGIKRSKTRCLRTVSYSPTQCRDTNEPQRVEA